MKQGVLFIHGGNAYSKYEDYLAVLKSVDIGDPLAPDPKRWSKSLAESLAGDFTVFSPQMPNKFNAKYEEWKIWFERYLIFVPEDAILVGWSLGGLFLAKYLSENDLSIKVKALYLLATPFRRDNLDDEDGGDFWFDEAKLPLVENKVGKIVLMHSEDDFVVPYDHVQGYQQAWPTAELVTFHDKNHFLVEEFPEFTEHLEILTNNSFTQQICI